MPPRKKQPLAAPPIVEPKTVAFPCCEEAINHITPLHDSCDAEGRWCLLTMGHVRPPGTPFNPSRNGMTSFEVEIIFCPWCGARIGRVPPDYVEKK